MKGFIKDGVGQLAIARPDEFKGEILWKHPDNTIPNGARLTVGSDEIALFFRDGQFMGRFPAGRHVLDSDTIPFLGQLVDKLTGGDVFRAEIFYVSLLEFTGIKFGGRIGKLRDPESGLATELMVHGTFSLRVEKPATLVTGLTGMGVFSGDNFYGWFREQVLKTIRDRLAELCVKKQWPLLKVTSGAYTEEVEESVIEGVQRHCESYGISIVRLGNFNVNINKDDEKRLEDFYEKAAYIRMSGGMEGYSQLADAEMRMGAAKGLAKGGGEGGGNSGLIDGAGLGMGLAVGQQIANQQSGAQPQVNLPGDPPPTGNSTQNRSPSSDLVTCGECESQVSPGKFCSECGSPLAPPKPKTKFCSECGSEVSGNFCSECGTPTG